MQRRTFLTVTAIAGLTGVTGCSGKADPAPGAPVARPVTVGLSYIPNVQFAPFYVGSEQGIFARHGLGVTLRHHGAQEGLFTALTAGQEDFLIAGGDELMVAREQGMDLVAIAGYYQSYPITIIVKDGSPIQQISDLAGKKIGIPGRYGESWYGLRVALASAGLSENSVSIVEIGYTQQAALTTDKVDAVVGYANNEAVQFVLAGVPVRKLPLAKDVPLVSICLVTTSKVLKEKRELAQVLTRALSESITATVGDRIKALESSQKFVPTLSQEAQRRAASATLEATVPLWAPGGAVSLKLDPKQWAEMSAFLAMQNITKTAVSPNGAVDTTIVAN